METSALTAQRPLVEKFLRQYPQNLSGFSFVNLFAWQGFWDYEFKTVHDSLCVFARNHLGAFLALPPLGRAVHEDTAAAVFEEMDAINGGGEYSRIENVGSSLLKFFPEDRFRRYLRGHETVYYRRDVTSLKGASYKSKRGDYNYFVKHASFEVLPFDENMAGECAALYDAWAGERGARSRDDVYIHMLQENRDVHRRVLQHAAELGVTGRVVRIDGRIGAYTFGYPVNENVFCVFLEIADLNVKGLSAFVFREFCADPALRPYRFINVMDDFAMEGVTRAKMSFRPCVFLPCYVITRK